MEALPLTTGDTAAHGGHQPEDHLALWKRGCVLPGTAGHTPYP